MLQAALSGNVTQSSVDPICRKILRWQLEKGQVEKIEQVSWEDELHSTWVDELTHAAVCGVEDRVQSIAYDSDENDLTN